MDAGPGQGRSGARSCRKTLVPLGIGGHTAKPDGQSPPWSLTITCHCFPHQARVDMGPLPKDILETLWTLWIHCYPIFSKLSNFPSAHMRRRIRHGMLACGAEFGTVCGNATPNSARYVSCSLRGNNSARGNTGGHAQIRHGMPTCGAEFDIPRRILTCGAESPPRRNWARRILRVWVQEGI